MPTSVTLNGVSYVIPTTGEGGWSPTVDNYLIALATGVLAKTGGAFTLTAEADFGANFGLKALYFKSRATTPAAAGEVRLGNAEAVSWRNQAGDADLALSVSTADRLEFGAVVVPTISSTDELTNKTIVAASNTITTAASGNLVATELDAALAELQTDIDTRALGTGLSEHISATTVHGTTSAVVGVSDVQAITNKDIDGGTASNTSRITVPKASSATLAGLTRKQATIVYDTTLGKALLDDGTALQALGGGLEPTPMTANTTAESGKLYLVTTNSDLVLTLPDIATEIETIGVQFISGTGTVTVAADASDNIGGASQLRISNLKDWRVLNAASASAWAAQSGSLGNGVEISEWQTWTPPSSQGLGTLSSVNLEYRQVGESFEFCGEFTTGTVPSDTVRLGLPSGLTVGGAPSLTQRVGTFDRDVTTVGIEYTVLATQGDTYLNFGFKSAAGTSNALTPAAGTTLFGNGERIVLSGTFPIAEWANSGTSVTLRDLTRRTKELGTSVVSVSNSNGGTVTSASFQAVSDSLGNYRLYYEIFITGATSTTTHTITLGLGGSTFAATVAGSIFSQNSRTAAIASGATINVEFGSASGSIVISGSAPLSAKPSWFDANAENDTAIDAQVELATATVPGLLPSYEVATLTADGNFNSGSFTAVKIGRVVTITGQLGHPSATGAEMTTGLASQFRPTSFSVYNTYIGLTNNVVKCVRINTSGVLRVDYTNNVGTVLQTSTEGITISYVV